MVFGEETHARPDFELLRHCSSSGQFNQWVRKMLVVVGKSAATEKGRAAARRNMGMCPHQRGFEAVVFCPPSQFYGWDGRVRNQSLEPEIQHAAVPSFLSASAPSSASIRSPAAYC